jgi:lipid II:glycine glycyltransferase (peptidoglycan interpeptide bridge formation enzyme)
MTVKIITDRRTWEKFVDLVSPIALFQRWDWGEVQKLGGTKTFRFGYYSHGTLIGIAQAVVVGAKRGSFLHIRHGPVIPKWNKATSSAVLIHLRQIARENNCVCIRISPCLVQNEMNEVFVGSFGGLPAAIHAMDAEYSWVLNLDSSEEELLANMRKTTRYEIRRAGKLGVSIEKTTNLKSLSVFFDLYNKTAIRHGFVEHQSIKEEFSVFASQGNALHIIGRVGGVPIASAIILFVGSEAIYHHGASESSSIPASYLVQWEVILEAKKRGMKNYNFWGIAPTENPHHPWHGLTKFKKGFGGDTRALIHAYDVPLSWKYWLFRVVELIRKQYKGY